MGGSCQLATKSDILDETFRAESASERTIRYTARPVAWIPLSRYFRSVIASFGDRGTSDLFHGRRTSRVRRLPTSVIQAAIRKLDLLNAAHALLDLRSPPGNRLELLKGDWEGFHSIRVNDQWRLVFRWVDNQAHDVALVDYH